MRQLRLGAFRAQALDAPRGLVGRRNAPCQDHEMVAYPRVGEAELPGERGGVLQGLLRRGGPAWGRWTPALGWSSLKGTPLNLSTSMSNLAITSRQVEGERGSIGSNANLQPGAAAPRRSHAA